MTKTTKLIENRLFIEIENRINMEKYYLQDLPLKDSQLAEYYTLCGFINALNWILAEDIGYGLHEYTSEIKIKDVLANLIPHISSHPSQCPCHACITNDVLQDFIIKGI